MPIGNKILRLKINGFDDQKTDINLSRLMD